MIHRVLTRAGYSVLLAADGEEALELSRGHAGGIDLLPSDIMMPRMDGVNLAARLREERPHTKTLLISGQMNSEMPDGDGFFDFLRKPFVPGQLRSKLEEILTPQRTP
jgi:CheY-like chemotaxis protein